MVYQPIELVTKATMTEAHKLFPPVCFVRQQPWISANNYASLVVLAVVFFYSSSSSRLLHSSFIFHIVGEVPNPAVTQSTPASAFDFTLPATLSNSMQPIPSRHNQESSWFWLRPILRNTYRAFWFRSISRNSQPQSQCKWVMRLSGVPLLRQPTNAPSMLRMLGERPGICLHLPSSSPCAFHLITATDGLSEQPPLAWFIDRWCLPSDFYD